MIASFRGCSQVLRIDRSSGTGAGNTGGATDPQSEIIAIQEVDPATGTSLFEMHMSSSLGLFQSYRVYLLPEDQVTPPLNLP